MMDTILDIFGVYKCLWMTIYVYGILTITMLFMILQLMED